LPWLRGFFHTPMPKTRRIDALLARLADVPQTPALFNPFKDARLAGNMRQFLLFLARSQVDVALVGEAAGHRGCALTGMPFTSPETLAVNANPFFSSHRETMFRQGDVFEPSGRYVWGTVDAFGVIPLLWNALPLHPHLPGKARSNRTPTNAELELGKPFLADILDIFQPRRVVAVGRKAERSLGALFPGLPFDTVRHPAMGGSNLFRAQMAQILA